MARDPGVDLRALLYWPTYKKEVRSGLLVWTWLQVKCCLVLRLEFGEGHWSFQDRCIESLFTWMMMVCTQPAVAPQETRTEDLVPSDKSYTFYRRIWSCWELTTFTEKLLGWGNNICYCLPSYSKDSATEEQANHSPLFCIFLILRFLKVLQRMDPGL